MPKKKLNIRIAETAVEIAENKDDDARWAELSTIMCWRAVVKCAYFAGAMSEKKCDQVLPSFSGEKPESFKLFVDPLKDSLAYDPATMKAVPPGSFLAFVYENEGKPRVIHAMVSVGDGWAAGTKNSCIGIGNDAGWEFLNLAKELEWMPEQQGFNAVRPGQSGVRFVQIRYRKIKKI